jgi:hypothetical protein
VVLTSRLWSPDSSSTKTKERLFVTGLLERDVLVISQEAKLIEMNNEYRILDPEGVEVGTIRQEVSRRRSSCSGSLATWISS